MSSNGQVHTWKSLYINVMYSNDIKTNEFSKGCRNYATVHLKTFLIKRMNIYRISNWILLEGLTPQSSLFDAFCIRSNHHKCSSYIHPSNYDRTRRQSPRQISPLLNHKSIFYSRQVVQSLSWSWSGTHKLQTSSFLAHLSRKIKRTFLIPCRPSFVCP